MKIRTEGESDKEKKEKPSIAHTKKNANPFHGHIDIQRGRKRKSPAETRRWLQLAKCKQEASRPEVNKRIESLRHGLEPQRAPQIMEIGRECSLNRRMSTVTR